MVPTAHPRRRAVGIPAPTGARVAATAVRVVFLTRHGTPSCGTDGSGARVTDSTIIYTHTDEAPALATYSFLPVVQAYAATAGVRVETRDISLAGRILAGFPDRLPEGQRVEDALGRAGPPGHHPGGQHHQAAERLGLQPPAEGGHRRAAGATGTRCPTTPTSPATDEEREVRSRYDKVMGSAVNPVLRQGNSDRRAPASVKHYAQAHPHRMGAWSPESRTNVAHMEAGDFRSTERSAIVAEAGVAAHRAGGGRRHHHRAAAVGAGAGRRGGRRLGDAGGRPARRS